MYGLVLRVTAEIVLRGAVVTATLLMVASADIIGKCYLTLDVDIPREASFAVAGRASVARGNPFVRLQNKCKNRHLYLPILTQM